MTGREDVFQKAMSEGHSATWDQMWDQAVAAYKKALAEFPDNPKALSSLGLVFFQSGHFEDALSTYEKASIAAPEDPVPFEKVAQLSERLGNLQQAIQGAMQAAELYIKNREVEKAIENWTRVTQLDPENTQAHSRLAMVYERLEQIQPAVAEYLALAGLLQHGRNADKAAEMVGRALRLAPDNPEARQAQTLFKSGQALPMPQRMKGGTGPLRMSQVRQMESPKPEDCGVDPISEARQKALTKLAAILFEYSEDVNGGQSSRRGMTAIVKGTGQLSLQGGEKNKIVLHISQAIEARTNDQEAQAAEELEHALEAGFTHPALYFDLGLLRSKSDRLESALRYLQHAVKHPDYALGARLVMAQILHKKGRLPEAAGEYMEALKLADTLVVSPEQSDEIRQLYEPLIEALSRQTDIKSLEQLCGNISELLLRPDWRANLIQAREQLPKSEDGKSSLPLAEILTQAQSSQVIEAISAIKQLAGEGRLRSAMDEAFHALKYAPTYLPLHALIGELLIQDEQVPEAIAKFAAVAHAYSVRGESARATSLFHRIIQLAPMDLSARGRLIEQLTARGQTDEAIAEYMELADIYYRQAEMDMARKTFATALHLAQKDNSDRSWSVKIMQRMADIDVQRLDWRQALRIFEQIRTLKPEDIPVRRNLVDLNLRLDQQPQASAELDNFIAYLESNDRRVEIFPFLTNLVNEYPDQATLRRYLAEEYRQAERISEAVSQLKALQEIRLKAGDRPGAMEAIRAIIAMEPPNLDEYKRTLEELEAGK